MTIENPVKGVKIDDRSMTGIVRAPARIRLVAASLVVFALAGCAETRLAVFTAKEISRTIQGPERPTAPQRPSKQGVYKVGKPYQVAGVWYYPREDPQYRETGIASWYGPKFHGRQTANGEVFDMNGLSAAHKTLPLPTTVRVTNLENGRSLNLRVNDRGPFVHGRIIDVSRRAAQLLGFADKGTARVQVEIIGNGKGTFVASKPVTTPEERTAAAAAPREAVSAQRLAPPPGTEPSTEEAPTAPILQVKMTQPPPTRLAQLDTEDASVSISPVKPTKLYIQAGAFIDIERASILSGRLSALGRSEVTQAMLDGTEFFRVRVGPISSVEAADRTLEQIIALGHPEARIIVLD